jgi:hypothetical protein
MHVPGIKDARPRPDDMKFRRPGRTEVMRGSLRNLPVFKARCDFGDQDITILELSVSFGDFREVPVDPSVSGSVRLHVGHSQK